MKLSIVLPFRQQEEVLENTNGTGLGLRCHCDVRRNGVELLLAT